MPLYLGGLMFLIGIGGGITMVVVSRGETGPLKDRAEAAEKKLKDANDLAARFEAEKKLAETNLKTLKENPPRDPALADAQKNLKAAEKQIADLRKSRDAVAAGTGAGAAMPKEDLDPSAPGGKDDPVMPRGKLGKPDPKMEAEMKGPNKADPKRAAEVPDGIPTGGKNWSVASSIAFGDGPFKQGDRIWLWSKDDAAPKVVNGKLTIKYKWNLRKGKALPDPAFIGLVIQEPKQFRMMATAVALSGPGDESEVTFDVKAFKGKLPVFVYIGSGPAAPNAAAYSSMVSYTVDFGGEKEDPPYQTTPHSLLAPVR